MAQKTRLPMLKFRTTTDKRPATKTRKWDRQVLNWNDNFGALFFLILFFCQVQLVSFDFSFSTIFYSSFTNCSTSTTSGILSICCLTIWCLSAKIHILKMLCMWEYFRSRITARRWRTQKKIQPQKFHRKCTRIHWNSFVIICIL